MLVENDGLKMSTTYNEMIGTQTRLAVQFAPGHIVDAASIYQHLCQIYKIGYVGIYDCGTHTTAEQYVTHTQ